MCSSGPPEQDRPPDGHAHRRADSPPPKSPHEDETHVRRLEELGRLAGAVAHDFNNLLTVIRSYASLLLAQSDAGRPIARSDIAEIEQAAVRGSDLTARLLSFARKQAIEPRVVDLPAAVSALDGMLRPLVGTKVDIEYRMEPDTPPVLIDPVQLDQVVINLAVNAGDAMPDGGQLVISCRRSLPFDAPLGIGEGRVPADSVMLEVSDTGHGMDVATLQKSFEPFYTTKTIGRGTGLGLSVISGIVLRAGGAFRVRSTPGAGTTFTIHLPPARSDDRSGPTDDPPAREGKTCVMIVEDDAEVRRLSRRLLLEADFDVATAGDGRAAQHRFETEWPLGKGPSVVLTDIAMPHDDGWTLAAWLLKERPGLPVVLMSALDWQRGLYRMPDNVPVPILRKPYSAAQLFAALREALEWSRSAPSGKRS